MKITWEQCYSVGCPHRTSPQTDEATCEASGFKWIVDLTACPQRFIREAGADPPDDLDAGRSPFAPEPTSLADKLRRRR